MHDIKTLGFTSFELTQNVRLTPGKRGMKREFRKQRQSLNFRFSRLFIWLAKRVSSVCKPIQLVKKKNPLSTTVYKEMNKTKVAETISWLYRNSIRSGPLLLGL